MKGGGNKIRRDARGGRCREIFDDRRKCDEIDGGGGAQMAALRGQMKDAVYLGSFGLGWRPFMACLEVGMGVGSLMVEQVVNPVGRGIDQEAKKECSIGKNKKTARIHNS